MSNELREEFVFSALLFSVFFAAILIVTMDRFSEAVAILTVLVNLPEWPSKVGPEAALEYAWRAIRGVVR